MSCCRSICVEAIFYLFSGGVWPGLDGGACDGAVPVVTPDFPLSSPFAGGGAGTGAGAEFWAVAGADFCAVAGPF